jgi:hypothetical protein
MPHWRDSPKTIRSRTGKVHSDGIDRIIKPKLVLNKVPLMHLRGADSDAGKNPPKSKLQRNATKHFEVENLMTLKQACPSEYQRAQGAFKDSMIH